MATASESSLSTNRFTDVLRERAEPTWTQAVNHRFVREVHDGTIADEVMTGYLIQDHRFLDSFLSLLGGAIASADTFEARLRFARFAGEVAGGENTYFLRSFDALGVTEQQRAEVPNTTATSGFIGIFREAARTLDYAAALSVLLVTEWLYLDWATNVEPGTPKSDNFVHTEWVALHDGPDFAAFVDFLRQELDRVGPASEQVSYNFFGRTVELELAFFDQSYEYSVTGAAR